MTVKTIINYLIKEYPLSLQEEWDESGLLNKGNLTQEIKKVFVSLDLNQRTIDEAIKQNVKLIISHHPIFRKNPEHKISSFNQKLIQKIKQNKITVLSLHTCFDNSPIGMNFIIGTRLNLKRLGWYKNDKFVTGSFNKSLSIKEIANKFKTIFDVSLLTTNANSKDKFSKIVFCAGSGLSVIEPRFDELAKQKILIVTGDIKYHGWQDLTNYKLKALDVGHDIENCFSYFIANLIKTKWQNIDCLAITSAKKEKSV